MKNMHARAHTQIYPPYIYTYKCDIDMATIINVIWLLLIHETSKYPNPTCRSLKHNSNRCWTSRFLYQVNTLAFNGHAVDMLI